MENLLKTHIFRIELFSKQAWLWSEGERMRKRLNASTPVHKYGIYSLSYKTGSLTAGQLNEKNENSTEQLMTRVKGILQKVDTMHLHEDDQTDSNSQLDSLESYENDNNKTRTNLLVSCLAAKDNMIGAITPPTSASDNEVTETEEDSTASTSNQNYLQSRRRKSPVGVGKKSTTATTSTATAALVTATTQAASAAITNASTSSHLMLRRTPPIQEQSTGGNIGSSATPLYSEKKLKKPSSIFDTSVTAALQRPTIASTVKMTQAAIEKTKAQTQGDKLNQIKAMRRQHTSRLSGGANTM